MLAGGGEFGVALLTILARGPDVPARSTQLLLAAVVLGMIVSPMIIRYNKRIARLVLREHGPPSPRSSARLAANEALARASTCCCAASGASAAIWRTCCMARASNISPSTAMPPKVRTARQGGEPVVWGDCADEELLRHVGLDHASVVIVTFADPQIAIGIVRAVRRLRGDVPVLVRTQDDSRLTELSEAGATEVVPETFEASLTLVSQALTLLQLPAAQVAQRVDTLRRSAMPHCAPAGRVQPNGTGAGTAAFDRAAARRLGRGPATAGNSRPRGRSRVHRHAPSGHHRPRAGRRDRAAGGRRGGDLRHCRRRWSTPKRCCWPG